MGAFQGYLLKFPKTDKIFPDKYIQKDSYKSTPLQRNEIRAKRNNKELDRVTSPYHKTKIEFSLLDGLTLTQWRKIRNIIFNAMIDYNQRKVRVTYWDDEKCAYRTMTAYIPDITYSPKKITQNDIIYSPIAISFIEY